MLEFTLMINIVKYNELGFSSLRQGIRSRLLPFCLEFLEFLLPKFFLISNLLTLTKPDENCSRNGLCMLIN